MNWDLLIAVFIVVVLAAYGAKRLVASFSDKKGADQCAGCPYHKNSGGCAHFPGPDCSQTTDDAKDDDEKEN